MTETFKNKDGSVTTRVTTVEEITVPAEEVEATLLAKASQLENLKKYLEDLPAKYNALLESETASVKTYISNIEEELKVFN
jgi:hypothetical protein